MSLSEQTTNTIHIEELKEMPLVFFDRVAEHIDVPKVTTDDFNSGFKATEHLIQNGCKRIAFLSISQVLSVSKERLKGYLDALKKNKIERDNSLIVSCTGNDEENNDSIRKLLKRKNKPDGVFASVEKLAISTYEICAELKVNIPRDVKIITLSNSYLGGLLNPSLTTMAQPAYEMGREAATILFKLIEKKRHHFLREYTVLNSTLIIRNSTKAKRIGK